MTTKTTIIATIAAAVAMAGTAPAFADRIDKRQFNQNKRIEHGVRTGMLTKREAKKLREQQREISILERLFRKDGRLTKQERKLLNQKQNQASKRIYRKKHNDRVRGRRHAARDFDNDYAPYRYMRRFYRDYVYDFGPVRYYRNNF